MATSPVVFWQPAGLTLTARVFALGSDTQVGTDYSPTEATNRKGRYSFNVTSGITGAHDVHVFEGATLRAAFRVVMVDDTTEKECRDPAFIVSGTGAGQLSVTSGVVQADAAKWGGTAVASANVLIDGSIGPNTLTADAIGPLNIASGAIDADAIADGALTAAKFGSQFISGSSFASNAITSSAIADNTITDAKVASDVTIASVTGSVGSVASSVNVGALGGSSTALDNLKNMVLSLVTGTVTADVSPTTTVFDTSITTNEDQFTTQNLLWTSGANAGMTFKIESYQYVSGSVKLTLASPMPNVPSASDAFLILGVH